MNLTEPESLNDDIFIYIVYQSPSTAIPKRLFRRDYHILLGRHSKKKKKQEAHAVERKISESIPIQVQISTV